MSIFIIERKTRKSQIRRWRLHTTYRREREYEREGEKEEITKK